MSSATAERMEEAEHDSAEPDPASGSEEGREQPEATYHPKAVRGRPKRVGEYGTIDAARTERITSMYRRCDVQDLSELADYWQVALSFVVWGFVVDALQEVRADRDLYGEVEAAWRAGARMLAGTEAGRTYLESLVQR